MNNLKKEVCKDTKKEQIIKKMRNGHVRVCAHLFSKCLIV